MKEKNSYYADTSFILDLMKGKKKALEIQEEIDFLETGTPCIYEIKKGMKLPKTIIENKILELNIKDVKSAAKLYNLDEKDRIGEIDYLIAGQALARGTILITRDKDFSRFEGDLQTWIYSL